MRMPGILALLGTVGLVGCTGALQAVNEDLKKANEALAAPRGSSASIDTIGAPGGYQVRSITLEKPSPLCSYQTAAVLGEADAAFMAGAKDGYIETWNKSIDARKPLLPKSAEQKARHNYYKSKEIKATPDIEENRYRYLRTAQQTQAQTNRSTDSARYLRAACIEKAYSEGNLRGSIKAEQDLRVVIEKAPSS